MDKYYVVGDTHSDLSFCARIMRAAEKNNVHTIFQVGDFGIWDHTDDGVYFLDKMSELSIQRGIEWYVTLGNHENYDSVERYESVSGRGNFIKVRDNITIIGNKAGMFELNGLRFASLGGAYSIDKYARVPGKSWWQQEMINYDDIAHLEHLVDIHGAADILLTHDAPTSLPTWPGFVKDDPYSEGSRKMMDIAYDIARPKIWFHGHYHKMLTYRHNDSYVYGLGANPPAMPSFLRENDYGSVALLMVDDSGSVTVAYDNEWVWA